MSGLPSGFNLALSTQASSILVIEVTMPEDTWFAFSFGDGMCQTDMLQFIASPQVPTPVVDMWSAASIVPPDADAS